ncbi:hypothetical protein PENTCL1PPCAC_9263 [Pristionchus entomophagus]|uniref:Cyclin-like domain-containing protein n=1 Tax=Pristionchus entomophagus TaxID=358040 RepID=A0AAV5T2K9_9BILA|nr:hypothetical protein PENTCL1PPCAC_9263 [Pristionchus entomophagus]
MRRASLAPETLYGSSSAAAASVASRYRCDEQPIDFMRAAAAAGYSAAPAAHHQLHQHHHHTTTSFKPVAGSGSSGAPPMVHTARRRSLPIRGAHHHRSMIVGGQLPAHRRHARPVVAPETRLNSAQHPHVQPIHDAKIQMDERTLKNLKDTERDTILTGPTFLESAQSELLPQHRATVVQWMRDVLCEDAADEEVFPLSVLILDNYLTIDNILLRDVQGIASACMLMASKMKAPAPINAARLSFFTENSVTSGQIVNFELIILRALKWQVALPTAFDFADQVFCRVPNLRVLRTHFTRALYDMQLNVKDAVCRPSMQAAVSLARAARALAAPPALLEQLRTALADHLDFDLDVALRMRPAAAPAASTPTAESSSDSEPEEADAAFDASSLAYTPVYEGPQAAAVAAAVPAVRAAKSPPVTPPSGTDSGFCSTQGTPEGAESDGRPPNSPFF